MNNQISQNIAALIIDDEIDICYLLGSLLNKRQVKTEYVNTLKDAANVLKVNNPEIIFLDNHLPDGMGINFVGYIKKFYPLTKIVMITAFDTVSDKQKAFKEGVDYFIGKPFSKEKVNAVMENLGH